ncbi:MAG: sulfur carrier protein ThiS adenylyltransferase ThiF [Candidatus Omnitrophota bacterium]
MNLFEMELEIKFGKTYLEKLCGVKVGIAGAGGLGSNCAANLVRCGFKRFVIADFDVVEFSNMNRQFYFYDQAGQKKVEALKTNLLKINPDLEIDVLHTLITGENVREIFLECEVVVEAFDKAGSKKMIVEAFMGREKFVVSASGLGGIGRTDEIRSRRVGNNLVIVGDLVSDSANSLPVSPRVNIAAAKQADAVLEYVLARPDAKA